MTTNVLMPRLRAQQLINCLRDRENQLLPLTVNASIARLHNSISAGTSLNHTNDLYETANLCLSQLSIMDAASRCHSFGHVGNSVTSPGRSPSGRLLTVPSLPTSHRSSHYGCKELYTPVISSSWLNQHPPSLATPYGVGSMYPKPDCVHGALRTFHSSSTMQPSYYPLLSGSPLLSGPHAAATRHLGLSGMVLFPTARATQRRQSGVKSCYCRVVLPRPLSGPAHPGGLLASRFPRVAHQSAVFSAASCSRGRSSSNVSCSSSSFATGSPGEGLCRGGSGLGAWRSASKRSQRRFSTSSWGPGVGGGGQGIGRAGSTDGGGSGLPPPIIISPVACRVVVIGWMGCSKRYLSKYGSLWARSGDHEVLMIRPTVMQTLVRWRGVVVAGRDIDRVARMHRENPAMPTIYHIFSTGGFIHAGTMWRWMDEVEDVAQRRDLLEEVRGIILDSAPAAVNPAMTAQAIVSAVTSTPAEQLSFGMPGWQGMLLEGTRSFMSAYLQGNSVKIRSEEVYDAWYNLAPVCPQLYLYSDADPLVPTSDVERYMGVQEGRGVEVSGYKWASSGHVDHFRRYPQEYSYQISAFLARVLRDW